jgi:peroxiredoxin Q/BCP
MRKTAGLLIFVLSITLALLAQTPASNSTASTQEQPKPTITEGMTAPDFTLPSEDGTPVSLKQYRGQWVVLYFYPKDFTSGCTLEAHNFQRDEVQYKDKHAVILGVSVDNADSHKQFCAKEGLNFKLLADTDMKASTAYGTLMEYKGMKLSSRQTFIIDPQGVVRKAYHAVKPMEHSQEVLSALTELQGQKNASGAGF